MRFSRLARAAEPIRRCLFALVAPMHALRHRRQRQQDHKPRVAVLMSLPQDIVVLSPLLVALRKTDDVDYQLWFDPRLLQSRPETVVEWQNAGEPLLKLPRLRVLLGLFDVAARADLLISAAESSEGAHRVGHSLARLAISGGARAISLQHGLENVGLTYVPPGRAPARFAADVVAIWGSLDVLVPQICEETRRKCVTVGRLGKPISDRPMDQDHSGARVSKIVTVFENLHWDRYSADYRAAFWSDMRSIAQRFPELTLRIKPHPATNQLAAPDRGALVDSGAVELASGHMTVTTLAEESLACITTPSTVALDIAGIGIPVAVAAYDLDLPVYEPLPCLRSLEDWHDFLAMAKQQPWQLKERGDAFVARNVAPVCATG